MGRYIHMVLIIKIFVWHSLALHCLEWQTYSEETETYVFGVIFWIVIFGVYGATFDSSSFIYFQF